MTPVVIITEFLPDICSLDTQARRAGAQNFGTEQGHVSHDHKGIIQHHCKHRKPAEFFETESPPKISQVRRSRLALRGPSTSSLAAYSWAWGLALLTRPAQSTPANWRPRTYPPPPPLPLHLHEEVSLGIWGPLTAMVGVQLCC